MDTQSSGGGDLASDSSSDYGRPARAGVAAAAGGMVASRLPVPAAAAAAAGSRLEHPWAESMSASWSMASHSQDSEVPLTPTACNPLLDGACPSW